MVLTSSPSWLMLKVALLALFSAADDDCSGVQSTLDWTTTVSDQSRVYFTATDCSTGATLITEGFLGRQQVYSDTDAFCISDVSSLDRLIISVTEPEFAGTVSWNLNNGQYEGVAPSAVNSCSGNTTITLNGIATSSGDDDGSSTGSGAFVFGGMGIGVCLCFVFASCTVCSKSGRRGNSLRDRSVELRRLEGFSTRRSTAVGHEGDGDDDYGRGRQRQQRQGQQQRAMVSRGVEASLAVEARRKAEATRVANLQRALPTTKYGAVIKGTAGGSGDGGKGQGEEEVDSTCAICLADMDDNDDVKQLSRTCGHCYHADCLDEWLRRSNLCPLCKFDVVPRGHGGGGGELAASTEASTAVVSTPLALQRIQRERRELRGDTGAAASSLPHRSPLSLGSVPREGVVPLDDATTRQGDVSL